MEHSLEELFPAIAAEWAPDQELKPNLVSSGSHKTALWICSEGHRYSRPIKKQVQASGRCPICSNRQLLQGFNDLATRKPELVPLWSSSNAKRSDEMLVSPQESVLWDCSVCEGSYRRVIATQVKAAGRCPICRPPKKTPAPRKALKEGASPLSESHPTIVERWSSGNKLNPSEVGANSIRVVEWRCSAKHLYQRSIVKQINAKGRCPICRGHRIVAGINDLASAHPEVLQYWADKRPAEEVFYRSTKHFTWRCGVGHSYRASIAHSLESNFHCRICSGSRLEHRVARWLENYTAIDRINDRSSLQGAELDIVADEDLAFEVNGEYWHSNKMLLQKAGMSALQYHTRKIKLAGSAGKRLFFIWEHDFDHHRATLAAEVEKLARSSEKESLQLPLLSRKQSLFESPCNICGKALSKR